MMNFTTILKELIKNRPVFHSEDDFKFALAQTIIKQHPNFGIRLERPFDIKMIKKDGKETIVRAPIDIVIIDENGNYIPIELKYKTKKTTIEKVDAYNDDRYELANHGASDIGRVSFRKDIFRIENFLESNKDQCKIGYVFIISNEKEYFDNILEKEVLNKNYSFHDDHILIKTDPGWNYDALDKLKYIEINKVWHYKDDPKKKHWTYSGDLQYLLNLKNEYKIKWDDYSEIGQQLFKFCLIEIK